MRQTIRLLLAGLLGAVLGACNVGDRGAPMPESDHPAPEAEFDRGPHGGRLLTDDGFALELAIFETGVPPEFHAWATSNGAPIDPAEVDLSVRLTRLGERLDEIQFAPQKDYLRGDQVVYEPHSFVVSIQARFKGRTHHWEYDNFEGRTRIDAEVAAAFDLETLIAGAAVLTETVAVYGRVEPNAERMRAISARFEGLVQSVQASLGDVVKQGQVLATIESNESLRSYPIKAPIAGMITERNANPGEQTAARRLFIVMDADSVWVNLAIFPEDRDRVLVGAPVSITTAAGKQTAAGIIDRIDIVAAANQSVNARVVLDNSGRFFLPGMYVHARIAVAEHAVSLAVKRAGLQSFRDFTVVYAQVGDEYEVRMLELGRQDEEWVEVLAGLEPGTRYVSANSYLVKADIEKSGASHDH